MAAKNEQTLPGTTIKQSSMEKMLRHNQSLVGTAPTTPSAEPQVTHQQIAEGLSASRPVLLPGVASADVNPRNVPVIASTRVTERTLRATRSVQEGVAGTAPSPGQDNLAFVPPTTSNTADPGNSGKGPDAETEPASADAGQIQKKSRKERLVADLKTLFAEQDQDDDKDNKDDEDEGDGKDNKDDEEGDGSEEGSEEVDEAVEVSCSNCGYEEVYDLSEAAISGGQVPLTPEGKLDSKCPMCGADMDLSMMGATNVGEISDPNPRTDPRGNSPQQESSIPAESLRYARDLMERVSQGAEIDVVVRDVIDGDFLARKRQLVHA